MRGWFWVFAISLTLASALLWLNFGSQGPTLESNFSTPPTPASDAQQSARHPAVSSIPISAAEPAKGNVIPAPNTAKPVQLTATRFRSGNNLRALVHAALVEGDDVALYYSKLYLIRCAAARTAPAKEDDEISPAIVHANRDFAEFCGSYLGRSGDFDKNEFYSVSKSSGHLNSPRNLLTGMAGLRAATADRDAEWFIELFSAMDVDTKFGAIGPFGLDAVPPITPSLYLAVVDAAAVIEVCSRWGCDQRFRVGALCLVDRNACKYGQLEEQFLSILASSGLEKLQVESTFSKARAAIGRWIVSFE